jgi:outer membrane protein OmpA-like peptidoglycan-associated protein
MLHAANPGSPDFARRHTHIRVLRFPVVIPAKPFIFISVRAARTWEESGRGTPGLARWLLPALAVSLLLHALLIVWARGTTVPPMSQTYYDSIVPRSFRIERAEVDPKLLEPDPSENLSSATAPQPVRLPDERAAFEKLAGSSLEATGKPALPQMDLGPSTPSAPDFTAGIAAAAGASAVAPDDSALREALLAERPAAPDMATAFSPEAIRGTPLAPEGTGTSPRPGFSNLDDLLARTGPLSPETAPILMPTDLLFDYDSADLRPQAEDSMRKLAALILRNPGSRFLIEGHTDSFGSDEYNYALSARRAETVRLWLASQMGVAPDRVETRGYGRSRLIAPPTGTVEEQQINRRVEIVIRAHTGP